MTDPAPRSLPEAARQLGVSLRVLRGAIRKGVIPAPPHMTATASLPPEWFDHAKTAASPAALRRTVQQKVPPFARYEGTSAWRKYPNRVREYNSFRASVAKAGTAEMD